MSNNDATANDVRGLSVMGVVVGRALIIAALGLVFLVPGISMGNAALIGLAVLCFLVTVVMFGIAVIGQGVKLGQADSDGALPKKPSARRASTDLLGELGRLREAGVLTEAEFDAKKKEILNRL